MSSFEIYTENEKFKRFENLINHKEILNRDEYDFCMKWDPETTTKYLFKREYTKEEEWLNLNVYSEYEHHEYVQRVERGF